MANKSRPQARTQSGCQELGRDVLIPTTHRITRVDFHAEPLASNAEKLIPERQTSVQAADSDAELSQFVSFCRKLVLRHFQRMDKKLTLVRYMRTRVTSEVEFGSRRV